MAGIISEGYESRRFTLGRQGERALTYNVIGTEDEAEVETLLRATVPAAYGGRVLEDIDAEPLGGGVWKCHARFVTIDGDDEYTFDTTGGTVHLTQSLATINSYAPSGMTPADFQGAIGVSEDKVEGVDVPSPVYKFSETHQFTDTFVLAGFKVVLFNMTGRMNDSTFKGLAAGECLFLGAAGSKRYGENWRITFSFAGSPNVSGRTIGDITGIDKLGWDYLWVRYADFADSFAFQLVKRPIGVYVERVSEPGDFSLLSIGT